MVNTSAIVCWMVALVYGVTALILTKRSKPFPFFTGISIPAEKLTDVRAYNRDNGKMWAWYAAIHVAAGLLALISNILGFVLFGLFIIPGLIVMYKIHKRIFNRYRSPESKEYY